MVDGRRSVTAVDVAGRHGGSRGGPAGRRSFANRDEARRHRDEHLGEYLEIEPPRRLVFTWASPFTGPDPSLVTVELEPDGPMATNLRIIHTDLPESVATSHRDGWGAMLDHLSGCLLAAGAR